MLLCDLGAAGQGQCLISSAESSHGRPLPGRCSRCCEAGRAPRGRPCRAAGSIQHGAPVPSMKRAIDIRITSPNVDLDSLPDYLRKDCILFYCKEAEPLARKIAALSDKVQLGDVNWQCASWLRSVVWPSQPHPEHRSSLR